MKRSPFRFLAAALILFCAALVTLGTPPAHAHEGEGILELESRGTAASASVPYVVRLTWANDGHPAIDATVTATPIDRSGTPQTPVPMQFEGEDGRYSGTVAFPSDGTWTVRFTSVTPAATLEITEEVTAPPTSTPSTTTTAAADEPAEPAVDVEAPSAERASDAEDRDDGGGVTGLVVGALVAAVVTACVVVAMRARRRGGAA